MHLQARANACRGFSLRREFQEREQEVRTPIAGGARSQKPAIPVLRVGQLDLATPAVIGRRLRTLRGEDICLRPWQVRDSVVEDRGAKSEVLDRPDAAD
ncbi:MAG: hypothetical protein MUO35_11920, partial [Anaerolineales bacterium]|nr:hypothetical protein [Anaerolineales bacterium]